MCLPSLSVCSVSDLTARVLVRESRSHFVGDVGYTRECNLFPLAETVLFLLLERFKCPQLLNVVIYVMGGRRIPIRALQAHSRTTAALGRGYREADPSSRSSLILSAAGSDAGLCCRRPGGKLTGAPGECDR